MIQRGQSNQQLQFCVCDYHYIIFIISLHAYFSTLTAAHTGRVVAGRAQSLFPPLLRVVPDAVAPRALPRAARLRLLPPAPALHRPPPPVRLRLEPPQVRARRVRVLRRVAVHRRGRVAHIPPVTESQSARTAAQEE